MQVSLPKDPAKLPCVVLPTIRTPRFFDRAELIQRIEEHFGNNLSAGADERPFRSLVRHGLSSVGKTTIALKYAENKLHRGELDALFWVYSEKLVSLKQSFTNIALSLKLPEARSGDHEENRAVVLNWLPETRTSILLIGVLAGRGRALVTTRNLKVAFEVADTGMEIANWDNEEGSKFLLHLLQGDSALDLEDSEIASAHDLADKLSGHALAISALAGVIHRRAWSIKEFMEFYNQHRSQVPSRTPAIKALWYMSFKSLDAQSHAILAVMSFLEPDSIPQALFEPEDPTALPASLAFCSDGFGFSEAIENVLISALIKRDEASRTFSLHRLVQASFKDFLGPDGRQQAFNNATIPLFQAFPRRDSKILQLYLLWDRCAVYLQHVMSLKDCFLQEKESKPKFTVLQAYCELSNSCQRYLLELSSYEKLESLVDANTIALNTLPEEQQTIGLQGSLTSHKGQLLVRIGKAKEGVVLLKKSYDIRGRAIPFNHGESTWAACNAATGIATLNQFEEAIEWYERCSAHFTTWSEQQSERKGEGSADIKTNLAHCLVWFGQPERARELLAEALAECNRSEPFNWAMAACTHFAPGTVDRVEHKDEPTEAHFMEAPNLRANGDQLRSSPFNGACMYRLGCIALDRGQLEAAIKHLRDALAVTEKRKHNMVAEHMRCLFKLSEALEQEPQHVEEASRLRDEAERLLRQRAPNAGDPGKESTYDNLIAIDWR
ncbi:Tetratricopeptide-like helical [Dichotomopilus funicola]|uniref:Tetratricopeptide-like helical n=1 Tax=Dichotomopilus funicola TaxID=1934379 RepID=A0AAN6UY94_9PEZI|nr:Tetratricopeptide-like helical [Dichotomopilus funicola]